MALPMDSLTLTTKDVGPGDMGSSLGSSMPGFAPLAMPAQSFRRFSRRDRRALVAPRIARPPILTRLFVFGGAFALTAYGAEQMFKVVSVGTITPLEWAMVVLFVITFSWVTLSLTASIAGFVWLLARRGRRAPPPRLRERTAVVMPIYNEAPSRVFGAMQAIFEDVERTGQDQAFDFFLLSDTTHANVWIAEERAFVAMRARLPHARLYYRRRRKNLSRKAGNIADFVTHWGGHYPHMVVLDADSLMTGEAIVGLAAAMEADPDAGIIQSLPLIVNRNTMFARLQQFAARIAGPVIGAGLNAWMGRDGNYWGHNAIIRTRAFADHCGLPDLPGKPPFGGHILSHDFVEAGLIRRAGYTVYMLPDLAGSYEESPPSLIDLATRDRRWCQGNLQHVRIIGARGFTLATRQHLAHGIMGYLVSPLWMAQLLVGIVLVLQSHYIRPEYFTADFSLFPAWPRFDYERALQLFELTIAILLAPKFLGLADCAFGREDAARLGRRAGARRLDDPRDRHFRRARADHDADPIRVRRPDCVRTGHRLESAAAGRRIDPVSRHRAPPSRTYAARRDHAVRGGAHFALPDRLDVADDRRPHSFHSALVGERTIVARTRLAPHRTVAHAGGDYAAPGC